MNMMLNQDFANNLEATGLDKTNGNNPALARLMQAWESKQGKNAKKAGGLGLVAISLSACGSDSDPAPTDPDGEGQVFNLMIGDDNLTGTALADTFNALLASATGSLTGVLGLQTLGETDIIDGGDGTDVLNANLNGTGLVLGGYAAPALSDVEVLNLTASAGGYFGIPVGMPFDIQIDDDFYDYAVAGLDLFNSTGYEQVWNIGSRFDLAVINVRENPVLGMDGVVGGTTYYVEFTSSALPGLMGDGQTVVANAVGTSEETGQARLYIDAPFEDGDNISTLNLAVSNTVRLFLDGEASDMSVFNITGSGVTELSGDDEFPNLEELDSTGYTGDLTLDVSGSDVLTSVATGGGADIITINNGVMNGDLSVDLGGDADILQIVSDYGYGDFDSDDISDLDFTGGVANTENLAFGDYISLNGFDEYGAVLDLNGVDADLEAVWFFEGVGGDGDFAIANSPVEDLTLNAQDLLGGDTYTEFKVEELDTGNVVNLTINADGELDIDDLNAPSLETLTLNQLDVDEDDGWMGDLYLDVTSDEDHDVSVLQTITADAAGSAYLDIDANDGDEGMNALTSISIVAGEAAELEMDGERAERQVQEFEVSWSGANPTGGFVDLRLPDGTIVEFVFGDGQTEVDEKFAGTGYTAELIEGNPSYLVVTTDAFAPADPITIDGFQLIGTTNPQITSTVTQEGVAADSFMALEDIVVSGSETADVDLDDVYGSFSLDVTADTYADVDVQDSNVVTINVTVGTDVVYDDSGVDGAIVGYTEIDRADIEIDAASGFGNPLLQSVTVAGADVELDLEGDLSSLTIVDLTGVTVQFDVWAGDADFAPAAGDYVTYLVGATSSDWENGDSEINLAAARETVTFTEADFGTVVLEGFLAGDDPATGDRIDLSQLGFTNNGQLSFEVGTYDSNGVWTADEEGADVRITDLAGGPEMSGEIIITDAIDADADAPYADIGVVGNPDYESAGQQLADDLSAYNMVYL